MASEGNFDVTPNLKWSVVRCATPYSNISKKKFLLCLSEKLVIITYPRPKELLNDRSYFANAVMRISSFWKTLELMTKGN